MPHVFIPAPLRSLTAGQSELDVDGGTVRQVIDNLEQRFPGLRARLCQDDDLKPGIQVVIDGDVASTGLLGRLKEKSEVHFLPSIGGG